LTLTFFYLLPLPEVQMGAASEPSEMQCSFGNEGGFMEKDLKYFVSFTGHVMAEVVSCWPVTTEALV
jgi:hypothetical protein